MASPSPWGTISARPARDGRLRYRLRGRVDGQLITVGTYDALDEAQAVAAAMLERLSSRAEGLTVDGWVEQHLARRERGGRHRALASHRQVLEQHVVGSRLGGTLVRRVRSQDVRQWVADVAGKRAERGRRKGEPLSQRTVRNALRSLSACLADAVEAGKAASNPCVGVPVPREAPRTDVPWTYLTRGEMRTLREGEATIARKPWTAYTLAVYAGLRQGEVWGLRWEDVRDLDGDEPHLVVSRSYGGPTKGNRSRRVPLFPPAVDALRKWRREGGAVSITGLVFPRRTRRRSTLHTVGYDGGWAERPGHRALLGLRSEVRFHDLRHTFAAALISGTWGRPWRLEEVQVLMGHASRSTTERYAHLAPEGVLGAAAEARAAWSEEQSRGHTQT